MKASGLSCVTNPVPSDVKQKVVGATITDADAARKNTQYINPYKTQFEMYFVSQDLVKHWLNLITKIENIELLLKEIQSIISGHVSIVLWTYITEIWQPYLKTLTNTIYMNIPIGPVCFVDKLINSIFFVFF
jgi:hypothetical protein